MAARDAFVLIAGLDYAVGTSTLSGMFGKKPAKLAESGFGMNFSEPQWADRTGDTRISPNNPHFRVCRFMQEPQKAKSTIKLASAVCFESS